LSVILSVVERVGRQRPTVAEAAEPATPKTLTVRSHNGIVEVKLPTKPQNNGKKLQKVQTDAK